VWRIKGTTPGFVSAAQAGVEDESAVTKMTGFLAASGDAVTSVFAASTAAAAEGAAPAAPEEVKKESDEERRKRLYGEMDLMSLITSAKKPRTD
jgi:hypothetical protein